MTRQEFVLMAMAAGHGDAHTAVQVQKLLFLIERKVPQVIGGPHFTFVPDAFGPLDLEVYAELSAASAKGLVSIYNERDTVRIYCLTSAGRAVGEAMLAKLKPETAEYLRTLSAWVRRQGFWKLVSAVYHAYPEMRVNGVFQERL